MNLLDESLNFLKGVTGDRFVGRALSGAIQNYDDIGSAHNVRSRGIPLKGQTRSLYRFPIDKSRYI
jgi:hypothetical protein